MKIKKLSEKDKNKDQEALFNVKSLEKDKENRPSFKTSVEDQEMTANVILMKMLKKHLNL